MPDLKAGEQYRFVVDMDNCSGCKSCVAACHSLNGLDESESFRKVGHLKATNGMPWFQTMTSACHHCLDPLCLKGCPVIAYVKDPVTGIVLHLDDQCIGCQYCLFSCPYEVPVYNEKLGIVRKCDMCFYRLQEGENTACAQACPTNAISIEGASIQTIRNEHERPELRLPDAPSPFFSFPSTLYQSEKGLPEAVEAAGKYRPEAQHAHMSLVLMLVLTQVVVGSIWALCLLQRTLGLDPFSLRWLYLGIFCVNGLALAIAGLHPGRPWLGFRTVLGWRTSWMSREILAFGLFSGVFSLMLGGLFLGFGSHLIVEMMLLASASLAIFCSVKIYECTPRVFWKGIRTHLRFIGTAGLAAWVMALFAGAGNSWLLLLGFVATLLLKNLSEWTLLLPQRSEALRRSAQILREKLWSSFLCKHALALGAGLILVLGSGSPWALGAAALILLATEFWERRMFFQLAVPLPGGWA